MIRIFRDEETGKGLIPKYAIVPIILLIVINMITYYGNRLITDSFYHYDNSLPLDEKIPLIPEFLIFYSGAFVQWVVGYLMIARESKFHCYKIYTAEISAKLLALICFISFPTTMVRPEVTGTGFFCWLLRFIYAADAPVSLFPSLHCFESFFCFAGCLRMKSVGKAYKIIMGIFTVGVCASTVFVKQHVLVDIPAGIAFACAGLLISAAIFSNKKLKAKLQ